MKNTEKTLKLLNKFTYKISFNLYKQTKKIDLARNNYQKGT